MRILSANDLRRALPMPDAISAMKGAFAAYSSGDAAVPPRTHIDVPGHDATCLFMPSYLFAGGAETVAVKAVNVYPRNATMRLPTIHAAVLLMDGATGGVLALLEGASLTAIRTGAASGAATDLLSRQDASVLAVFGAGVQARTQIEAVCTVRRIEEVRVFAPHTDHIDRLIAEMAGTGPVPSAIFPAGSPGDAVSGADIVCTATTSHTPVFEDGDLTPGVHINAVGSYLPEMQELPSATVARAKVITDSRGAVLAESGDLIVPVAQGLISADHIHADLGEIVLGQKTGRTDPGEVTLFKSVGIAVQDAAAARAVYRSAMEQGIGTDVLW